MFPMRFGYFDNIQDPTQSRDYSDLVNEMRERALACERAGMDIFWVPEHHFSIWGRELLGNPLLMAADLAARTNKIRIGLGAAIITFWHPLRLAEDIALLDHLTAGRLEVGVGRGNYGLEAANLNPPADPNKPAMNLKVFLETLGVLRAALTEERFSYKGDIYQFPAPGFRADKAHTINDPRYVDAATGELVKLTTYPRPRQKPMPPMWQMVSEAHDAIRGAAALDMGVVMWRPTIAELKYRLQIYKDAHDAEFGTDIAIGEKAAVVRDTFIADSEAEARKIAEEACLGALNFANWRGPRIYLNPGETLSADMNAALTKKLAYDFVRPRALFFGSPQQVEDQIVELAEETSIDHLMFKCGWPGLAHEHTMRSLERLSAEVLPRVRERLSAGKKGRAAIAEAAHAG
jgi:alkanesulfonate monooxygenase SsuD/methylene tetrahydromethanopterin reductase-like flavin-dependent oxidoreductase (luciferase family)